MSQPSNPLLFKPLKGEVDEEVSSHPMFCQAMRLGGLVTMICIFILLCSRGLPCDKTTGLSYVCLFGKQDAM
jgi:hypothetical protein